jgi:hypothetical protein
MNGINGSKKGSESDYTKIAGENNVDCIFFMLSSSFMGLSFWKVGPGTFCTMHRRILRCVLSLMKRGIPV